jgi:hypothetical protein
MKQVNPEAQARRERMREVAGMVARMNDADRAALAAKSHIVTIEGRALSVHNACMVASQNAGATVVGGFRQWIKAGRVVRKGEHGFAIWCPAGKKSDSGASADETGTDSKARAQFILATVFDVSQTDELTDEGVQS